MRKKKPVTPAPAKPSPWKPQRNWVAVASCVALGTLVGAMLLIGYFAP